MNRRNIKYVIQRQIARRLREDGAIAAWAGQSLNIMNVSQEKKHARAQQKV